MFELRDPKGVVVDKFANYQYVRQRINEQKALLVTLSRYRQHEAVVAIVLGSGCIFTHIFEMRRARKMLGGWRSLYGTPLIVDWRPCGNLRKWHPELIVAGRRT